MSQMIFPVDYRFLSCLSVGWTLQNSYSALKDVRMHAEAVEREYKKTQTVGVVSNSVVVLSSVIVNAKIIIPVGENSSE